MYELYFFPDSEAFNLFQFGLNASNGFEPLNVLLSPVLE